MIREKQPSLKDTILKSAFSSPSMESVEVNLDDTHLTINGKGIETGINLSGQMDKQKGGLILRRVKLFEEISMQILVHIM